MNSFLKYTLTILILLFCFTNIWATRRDKRNTIYAFGVATCLGDTTCYMSTIQVLDSATISPKTRMLENRASYAHQMEAALKQRDSKHYTCALFFDKDHTKLERSFLNIKRHIEKDKSMRLEILTADTFKFHGIPTNQEIDPLHLGN